MSRINVETVPMLGDNYGYLVFGEGKDAAVVDPADADAISRRAAELDLRLVAILATHHHGDHTAGNRDLAHRHRVRVYGHRLERDRIPALTDPLDHEEAFEVGGLEIRALHTPGHTRGSLCYQIGDTLFTGDTLFAAGCGRLFEGDAATMFASLHEVIRPLPAQTRVYCGHEYTLKNLSFAATVEAENPDLRRRLEQASAARARGDATVPFTLADELRTSPFLRCGSDEIRRALAQRFPGEDLFVPLQVFTRLRELRNVY